MEANRLMPSDTMTELQTPQHSYAVILFVCTYVTVSVWVMPGGKVTHCPNPATPPPKWPSCLDRKRSVMAVRSHLQSHALIIVFSSRPLLPQVAVSPPPHPHDTNLTKPRVSLGSFRPPCRSLSPATKADPARLWLITLCPTGSGEVIDMSYCVAAVGSLKKPAYVKFSLTKSF